MYNKINQSNNSNHMSVRMSKTNLYIKGLPVHFNDLFLEQLVPHKNKVKSVKAAMDEDQKCKGYGFIDFISEDSADEAKKYIETNYSTYPVKFAKENEKDRTNLYVTNIPREWTSSDSDKLKRIFEKYGEVQSAFIMQEKTTSKTTGVGFVRFSNEHDAEIAIECLENNKVLLPDCSLPIEAKYADKHNPETRRRRNADVNLKSYPFNVMTNGPPTDNILNRMIFSGNKIQDLLSLYPMFLSGGNVNSNNNNNSNHMSVYHNAIPGNIMPPYNPISTPPGLWNINSFPYLTNDFINSSISNMPNNELNCGFNPFMLAINNFGPLGNSIPTTDYCGNNINNNHNYIYCNPHITD